MIGYSKISTRFRSLCAASVLAWLWLASVSRAQDVSQTEPHPGAAVAAQTVTIPDGTAVQLRFAQPLRGMIRTASGTKMEAHRGDKIRLVVAEEVRVKDLVVIARGAIGQATIHGAWPPTKVHGRYGNDITPPQTGLSLQLDWIEDVTGQQVPVRAAPTGKSKPFIVEVLSQNGGMVARPDSMGRDVLQIMTFTNLITMIHQRTWIPTGTRITAFVHGAVAFDPAEIKQAQSLLPITNANALFTIYRTKGHGKDLIIVSCDEKELAPIGPRQYTSVELTPGKHVCRMDSGKPLEISSEAGHEYFLEIHYKTLTGEWELQSVPSSQGEDEVARSESITKE